MVAGATPRGAPQKRTSPDPEICIRLQRQSESARVESLRFAGWGAVYRLRQAWFFRRSIARVPW